MKHASLARGGAPDPRTTTPLYAFARAIDRESLAGLGNSLKQFPRKALEIRIAFRNFKIKEFLRVPKPQGPFNRIEQWTSTERGTDWTDRAGD